MCNTNLRSDLNANWYYTVRARCSVNEINERLDALDQRLDRRVVSEGNLPGLFEQGIRDVDGGPHRGICIMRYSYTSSHWLYSRHADLIMYRREGRKERRS